MEFIELRQIIKQQSTSTFAEAGNNIERIIFGLDKNGILPLITEIGVIPEDIPHDSSEEKLYSKVSDILFAKALAEINLEVRVLAERSDSADIIAQSKFHNYSLVGDAKSFRLSRTAKNQKDFKVESMAHWRGDCDYSVLCCPYYQYPNSSSQIYSSALNRNVSLFSWEYLYIMLSLGILESETLNIKEIWNQSHIIGNNVVTNNAKKCFIPTQDKLFIQQLGIDDKTFINYFNLFKQLIADRGGIEINFYEGEKNRVRLLSREEAINELLVSMKLDSKISSINTFISKVNRFKILE